MKRLRGRSKGSFVSQGTNWQLFAAGTMFGPRGEPTSKEGELHCGSEDNDFFLLE